MACLITAGHEEPDGGIAHTARTSSILWITVQAMSRSTMISSPRERSRVSGDDEGFPRQGFSAGRPSKVLQVYAVTLVSGGSRLV